MTVLAAAPPEDPTDELTDGVIGDLTLHPHPLHHRRLRRYPPRLRRPHPHTVQMTATSANCAAT